MYGNTARLKLFGRCAAIASVLACAGCSTPRHTNTLIFGTTTRVAIDASQEPTGALGVTIGYKRNEAVWMPLLANQDSNGKPAPSTCQNDDCRKFEGLAGSGGGAAGAGAKDTYSVLATFSGDVGGRAQNPEAKATLAQYFATGMAARLLAQYGGAAVVNSEGKPTQAEAISAEAKTIVTVKKTQVAAVVSKLSKTTGAVDATLMTRLLTLSPAKDLHVNIKTRLATFTQRGALEEELTDGPEKTVEALYKSIDQL